MNFKCYLRNCSDSILNEINTIGAHIINDQTPNCLLFDTTTMTVTTLNSVTDLNGNIDCAQNETFFLNLIAHAIRYKMYKKLFTDGDTYITIGYMYDSTKYIKDHLPSRNPQTFRECTFNEIIRHYIGVSFTQPAFIRITSNELSEYLHDLGYLTNTLIGNNGGIATSHIDNATAINISIDTFDNTNPYITWNCANRYDCGTNVELFKALTAMNNNTYYKQWITNGTEYVMCNTHELPEKYDNFLKATKVQLINLFTLWHQLKLSKH